MIPGACNEPHELFEFGVAAFSTLYNDELRDHLLLFGGSRSTPANRFSPAVPNNSTWIYSEKTNSWRILDDLAQHPTQRASPTMVTLCKGNVLMTGGLALKREGTKSRMLTDIWLFLGSIFEWRQVAVVGELPELDIGAQAVNVLHKKSPCACQEAILFFPCQQSANWTVIVELSCFEESRVYGWKQKITHSAIPAVNRVCIPIVASQSKEIVLTVVERCLWYLSVSNLTWTQTSICIGRDNAFRFTGNLKAVYLKESMTYVLFSVRQRMLLLFSLSTLTASASPIVGKVPFPEDLSALNFLIYRTFVVLALSLSESEIRVFIHEDNDFCGLQKWILRNSTGTGVWVWIELRSGWRSPETSLSYHFSYAVWRNKLYFLESRDEEEPSGLEHDIDQLWSLNLLSMSWELIEKSIRIQGNFDGAATSFANDLWLIGDSALRLWVYEANFFYSWRQLQTNGPPHPARRGYSLEAVSSNCIVLFGGKALLGTQEVLNDVWLFFYEQRTWKQVYFDPKHPKLPPPRYDHGAVTVNSVMFVYGGSLKNETCSADLWAFHFENCTWDIVKAINSGPRLGKAYCKAFVAAGAGQLWMIATGCSLCSNPYTVWTFIIHTRMWRRVGVKSWQTDDLYSRIAVGSPIVFWQGRLLILRIIPFALFSVKLGCPVGFASENISNSPCNICEIGFYAAEGSEVCSSCPAGTTTVNRESGTITDCSVCTPDYCRHGKCFVTISDSTPVPVCECLPGFSGTNCQYATYYYVGLGIALFLIVIGTGVTILVYAWRKRRLRERELRKQIDEMNGVWQISGNEVAMLEEIGKGASGSVWLAKYRDLTVAMKMLLVPDDPQMCLEFAREITFMQTIRHTNIVLFLGAGRFRPEGQPFLIVEFMRRGSLRHVLDDEGIQLTDRRKIQFATDVAKGMRFLHNLDPPRLHRDLKSENLLVSESWVVKVADFGLGRRANPSRRQPRSDRKQRHSLTHRTSLTIPLLDTEKDMSFDGIGTARWSAPELSRRQKYDASIDVYR